MQNDSDIKEALEEGMRALLASAVSKEEKEKAFCIASDRMGCEIQFRGTYGTTIVSDRLRGAIAATQGRPPLSAHFLSRNARAAVRGGLFNQGYAAAALSIG